MTARITAISELHEPSSLHHQLPARDHDTAACYLHFVREHFSLNEAGASHGSALLNHLNLAHSRKTVCHE